MTVKAKPITVNVVSKVYSEKDPALTFTANGSFSKFVGVEVDGKEVDAKSCNAKAGSTIITLKQSFLKRLSAGEHTITVLYTDGETSGTSRILAQTSTPASGDDSNIALYGAFCCTCHTWEVHSVFAQGAGAASLFK